MKKFIQNRTLQLILKQRWYLTSISFVLLTSLNGCYFYKQQTPYYWSDALTSHKVGESEGKLKNIWSRSNVFVLNDDIGVHIVTSQGKAFILGSLQKTEAGGLLALSGSNGKLFWQGNSGPGASLFATSSSVYASLLSTSGEIEAYDAQTGKLLWVTTPQGIRNVSHLYVYDNTVHINGSNTATFNLLDAKTGKNILKTRYGFGNDIFVQTEQETYKQSGTSLQLIDTVSEEIIWDADVESLYCQGPVFTDRIIYVRTMCKELGRVYAIDRQTGKILWYTEEDVMSYNVAATEATVYLLAGDGRLVGLDTQNGEEVTSVVFEPGPFEYSGTAGGYYVAVDEEARLLYAQLGDSWQLFAFQIVE